MASAVAASDPPAQASELGTRLYETHAEMLLRFCRRRLRDASEAEDAVQTTFVYAIRALGRGVVTENEEAWLTTIARNVCHSQRRSDARRGSLGTEVDLDAVADRRSVPGDHDELLGLDEALASIPEQQRRAILLREWRGAPPVEIARRLGLSPTATHALLTRARSSLALALTVARHPALALVWLVGELRSLVKALIGSATAKAGVAAVTVVATTGGTAVLVDRAVPDRSESPATPALVGQDPRPQVVSTPTSRGRATTTERPPAATGPPARRATGPVQGTTTAPRQSARESTTSRPRPSSSAPASAPAKTDATTTGARPTAATPPTTPVPVPDLPAVPELPAAPKLPLPTVPSVVPPSLPELPSPAVPPAVEVPQVPPVPETVGGATDAVRPPPTGVLP